MSDRQSAVMFHTQRGKWGMASFTSTRAIGRRGDVKFHFPDFSSKFASFQANSRFRARRATHRPPTTPTTCTSSSQRRPTCPPLLLWPQHRSPESSSKVEQQRAAAHLKFQSSNRHRRTTPSSTMNRLPLLRPPQNPSKLNTQRKSRLRFRSTLCNRPQSKLLLLCPQQPNHQQL